MENKQEKSIWKDKPFHQIGVIVIIALIAISVIFAVALKGKSSSPVTDKDSIEESGGAKSMANESTGSSRQEPTLTPVNTRGAKSTVTSSTVESSAEPTLQIPVNTGREVGIWYSTWYSKLNASAPGYTTENKNPRYDTWVGWDIPYKPLSPNGDFETYDALDEEVLTYHIQSMTDARIDFIIMDQTNHIDVESGYINERSIKMAQTIKKWNDNSSNKPLMYSSAVGEFQFTGDPASIEKEAKILYERYNSQSFGGPKYHYYLDGKPLLVVYAGNTNPNLWKIYKGSKEYADKFTIRWASNDSKAGYYGWAYNKGSVYHEEVVVVMPGWRNNVGHTPVLRNNGKWYEASWDVVFEGEKKPRIVVINSFNEYAERTAVWSADTFLMKGTPSEEDMWTNAEGVVDPYMYWNMTKQKISEYKAE